MSLELVAIGGLVLWLAWCNGANDVAKGVATLVGSGESVARRAVLWGGLWTVAGGLTAIVWGMALVDTFSRGLLAPGFGVDAIYLVGALAGAGGWVWLATRFGLPVSTTHALLGGIAGAALALVGPDGLRLSALANKAMLPLLLGPAIAILVCWALLLVARQLARLVPAWRPGCCPQKAWQKDPFVCALPSEQDSKSLPKPRRAQFLTRLHWLSSAAVSFGRGLNDAPKIAAFLWLAVSLSPGLPPEGGTMWPIILVALCMGLGSVWGGYRVLRVLAHRVVPLDHRNGVAANLTTSGLVLLASPLGLPLSTTHVATGALFGVRLGERHAPPVQDAVKMILFGWLVTLPLAALLAAAGSGLLRSL
ncbi:MAG: inorganic phosphate transporter [Pseudomonadota bacterium]